MNAQHIPVLLQETIELTNPTLGDVVFDGTLGLGGHSSALCARIGEDGILIGTDKDRWALDKATEKLSSCNARKILICRSFSDIEKILSENNIEGVDIALVDLGFNSTQLSDEKRGFSFQLNTPLVMSYDDKDDDSLIQFLNTFSEKEIADVIFKYGEERFARRIVKGICDKRTANPIVTTGQLVNVINESLPSWFKAKKINPATKVFQALRIYTNDELNTLQKFLQGAHKSLRPGGRLAVISFHSLEDKIVKEFFKDKKGEGKILTKKPITPTREEEKENPRARSAKLRVFKRDEK